MSKEMDVMEFIESYRYLLGGTSLRYKPEDRDGVFEIAH
jgi:hypothetical protein